MGCHYRYAPMDAFETEAKLRKATVDLEHHGYIDRILVFVFNANQ